MLVLAGASARSRSLEVVDRDRRSCSRWCRLATARSCHAYPDGGGAYVVGQDQLRPIFGLSPRRALLVDYVLTVSVSTSAAIDQIQSVIPIAYDYRIVIAFVSFSLITIGNLRGLRESGNIFAVPTYLFVGLALGMIGDRPGQHRRRDRRQVPLRTNRALPGAERASSRSPSCSCCEAFASGSVALTGVEAIANGVPGVQQAGVEERRRRRMTAMAASCWPSCSWA